MSDGERVRELAESILNLLGEKDASFALGMASLMEVIALVCTVEKIDKDKVLEALAFRLASIESQDPSMH
jgi:hypothetical protein